MPAAHQANLGWHTQRAAFQHHHIGLPLAVGFSGVDALLRTHAEIHHIHNCLKNRGDNRGTTRRSDNQPQITIFGNNGRCHGRKHAFARCHGVLGIAQKPKLVGVIGLDGEIIHFIIQKKAGTAHHHF